jgi:hypothetical protein
LVAGNIFAYVELRHWQHEISRPREVDVTALGLVMLLVLAAYWLGMHDGLSSRPPVLRGTYDSGDHDDRVEEYGDWR